MVDGSDAASSEYWRARAAVLEEEIARLRDVLSSLAEVLPPERIGSLLSALGPDVRVLPEGDDTPGPVPADVRVELERVRASLGRRRSGC